MSPAESPAPTKRGNGRALLLAAARELFTEHPYDEVTTKQITARAGVTEPILFRHFGNKARLFQEAALTPFIGQLVQLMDDWESSASGPATGADMLRQLVEQMFAVFRANRRLASELMRLEFALGEGSTSEAIARLLRPALARLADVLGAHVGGTELRVVDTAVVVRLISGLVVSQAVFRDVFYVGEDIDDATIVEDMVDLLMRGLAPEP